MKDDGEAVEITEWFQSIREEELDHLDETEDWRSRPSQQIDRKLKQLELNFRGILCERLVERKVEKEDDTEVAGEVTTTPTIVEKDPGLEEHPSYVRRTGKISKKEGKKLAAGNGKVLSWLRNMTSEKEEEKILYNTRRMEKEIIDDMEWIPTPDPGLEIARIVRVKEAAYKKERNINKYIVGNVVKEIIDMVIPLSMSSNIIDILITESVRLGMAGVIWNEMAKDDQLKDNICLRMIEEDARKRKDAWNKAKMERLEIKEKKMMLWKEKNNIRNLIKALDELRLETFDGEWEEHDLLDGRMLEVLASGLGDDDVVMVATDDAEHMIIDEDDMDMEVWLESIQREGSVTDNTMEVYEDWLEKELGMMMVDEETVKKVRDKYVMKFTTSVEKYEDNKDKKIYNEDNKIYYVEVACESNEDTVCGSGNDNVCNVSSDIADEAVHMHDDGQGLVVEGPS